MTTSFQVSTLNSPSKEFDVSAVIVPHVTCHLPTSPLPPELHWSHIEDLQLADPTYRQPGAVDLLLGVDIFVALLLHGLWSGVPGTPTALETEFGWMLADSMDVIRTQTTQLVTHHTAVLSCDLLRKFLEVEEMPSEPVLSVEEKAVMKHLKNHSCPPDGRFAVPLPRRDDGPRIEESRSQAV